MRNAAKRDKVEREIVVALQSVGCTVQRISAKGVADLLVGRHGENYLLEIKSRSGELTPDQVAFRENWEGQYAVVRSVEQALAAVGAL